MATQKQCQKPYSGESTSEANKEASILLIPGLPNHLAQVCLSTLHPSLLSSVCRSWRRLLYSPSFPPFFSLYSLLSPTNFTAANSVEFHFLDPVKSQWFPLPSPPADPPLRLLHRHPSFISRTLPIQSVAASGRLVLVAASNHRLLPALHQPLVFDPLARKWFSGPPLAAPRRWCATGVVDGTVYVASGVGSQYQGDVARLVERCDVKRKVADWSWEKMAALRDGRFSREAVEAVGYKGKLFMVNIKGNAVKQGGVYDVARDRWEEMPERMLAGWNGPAAAAEEEEMYVVDEEKGLLKKYNPDQNGRWEEVVESPEHLKGAVQVVAGRGRVCVVCADRRRIAVVDVAGPRIWVLSPPQDTEVVSVHILPRMSLLE